MRSNITNTLIIIGAALVTLSTIYLIGYTQGVRSSSEKLENLRGRVSQQEKQAKEALDKLTLERDAKQALLDKQAQLQEEKDNAAKLEIKRLANELGNRPIRVRVATQSSQCDHSAGSDTPSNADNSAGNTSAASGLLPESNSRRLRAAIEEIETLSAAYSSCRSAITKH